MIFDSFKEDCRYPSIDNDIFGLCDDENNTKAYPDTAHRKNWIAAVSNPGRLNIVFTAIDKCVINDHEAQGLSRCDGMLTTDNHLYLVELKNKKPSWREEAIEQLSSTIVLLKTNHDIARFKKRKTYACNKRADKFVVIDNEFNKAFYHKTGFRIDVQGEIIVV